MKRLSKILMLVLVLTLSCALFGTLASAEDAAVTDGTLFTVEKDGVVTEYPTGTALTNALVNGGKVVLYQDMTVSEAIAGATIDLNGHALTPTTTWLGDGSTLISSAPGGVVYGGALGASVGMCSKNATIGSAESERITMYVNCFSRSPYAYTVTITNCELFNMVSHGNNYSAGQLGWFTRVEGPKQTAAVNITFTHCNIYGLAKLKFVRMHGMNLDRVNLTMRDTNVYAGDSALFAMPAYNSTATDCGTLTLANTKMYTNVRLNETSIPWGSIVIEDDKCAFATNTQPVPALEGYSWASTAVAATGSITYKKGGVSTGADTPVNLATSYTKSYAFAPSAFTVDGVEHPAIDFNTNVISGSGKKVALLTDVVFDSPVSNVNIDLNGHALVANTNLISGGTNFIYNSSANGAALYASNGALNSKGTHLYVGYSDAETTVDGGRIFVTAKQITADAVSCHSYFYNCDLVNVNGAYARRQSWFGGSNSINGSNTIYSFENCRIYLPIATSFVNSNKTGGTPLQFKDTEIYAAAGGALTGQDDNSIGTKANAIFDNSAVYGSMSWNWYSNVYTWDIKNGSKFNTAIPAGQAVTLPDGSVVASVVETKTVTFTYAPTYGATPVEFSHTLSTNYEVGAAGNYDFTANNVYYKAAGFLPENINGKNVVLLSNITTDQIFSNLKLDLNGYDLTCTGARFVDGTYNYIYNNAETASNFIAGSVIGNGVDSQHIAVYFGYEDNGQTQADGRITMNLSSQFLPARNYATVYFNNVDFVNTVARDYTQDSGGVFYSRVDRGLTLNINNCNFYAVESTALMCGNQMSANGYSIAIANTSFYGPFTVFAACSSQRGGTNTATFNNVHFYNGAYIFGNGASMSYAHMITPVLDENCTFDVAEGQIQENLPEGMQIVPTHLSETVNFVYGDGENDKFTGTFTSRYKYGTEADVKAIFRTFYRNINIDVNINFNLYVPVEYTYALDGLKGATKNGTIVIGGKTYNVLTVKQAPKDAHTPVGVTLYGGHVTYSADVVGYTKSLLKLADTTEYNKDSKMMAKYILYYIKAAAVAAQVEADFTAIDTLLDGFTLSEEDKALTENTFDTSLLRPALKNAALDLSSNVGIVLQVQPDFVGTIKVTMAGMQPIEKTYTADAPAGEKEYIIIGDIPVYDFRNTITVEVDGTVLGTYNLATYVNNKKDDVSYATYAYSKAAYDYQIKHGNPSTAD